MIVVTGATGFIGSAFVWELNQQGRADVVCVDAVSPQERPGPLSKRRYDRFVGRDELFSFLNGPDGPRVEWIVHMGACSSTTELNVEFLRENNTLYTRKLWEWCAATRTPFIYASSGAVYGGGEKGFDDATDPSEFKALNPYGDSKLAFDKWTATAPDSPPHWYGLRFFNVYGPNEYHKGDMASVVYKAHGQIQSFGSLKLFRSHRPEYKDGEQLRDFVYVKDIVRWMAELMDKRPASGVYNMGFGIARTWLDLAKRTFAAMERPMRIEWMDVPEDMRPRYQYFTEARIDRLRKAGLSKPQWSLEEGVADYVGRYLRNADPYL